MLPHLLEKQQRILELPSRGAAAAGLGSERRAPLRLRRDRANAHDPNAIAVDVTVGILNVHAGFVKGTQAETLAPALDSGALAVVACVVDAPNGVDALPTSEVPVRLTLR